MSDSKSGSSGDFKKVFQRGPELSPEEQDVTDFSSQVLLRIMEKVADLRCEGDISLIQGAALIVTYQDVDGSVGVFELAGTGINMGDFLAEELEREILLDIVAKHDCERCPLKGICPKHGGKCEKGGEDTERSDGDANEQS
jgi:hypothetical protein